jgi:hypothetical protein
MWLLSTFIISTVGVLFLLFFRRMEVKSGRANLVCRTMCKGDPHLTSLWQRIEKALHHNRERTFFLFLVHIPSRAESFFIRLKAKTHDYYHGVNAKMRDKRNFSEEKVSPYMRSMSLRRDGDTGRI